NLVIACSTRARVGVDSIAPEGRVLKVLGWRIAEYVGDIVADKEGRICTSTFEAVDHSGRRAEQSRQMLLRRSLHLPQLPMDPRIALACGVPYRLLDDCRRSLGIKITGRDMQDLLQGRRGVLGIFARCHCMKLLRRVPS